MATAQCPRALARFCKYHPGAAPGPGARCGAAVPVLRVLPVGWVGFSRFELGRGSGSAGARGTVHSRLQLWRLRYGCRCAPLDQGKIEWKVEVGVKV